MSTRRRRCLRHFGAVFLSAVVLSPFAARSETNTWNAAPASSDYNTFSNWTPAAVPTDIAAFGTSAQTSISLSANAPINQFIFNPGASAYTFNPNGHVLTFNGAGISNSSSNTQTINISSGTVTFNNASNAGNSTTIINSGTVDISGHSSGLQVGSISGSGGFTLGGNALTVGSLNLSTTVSGVISGSGGSLIKVGTGTLTLTGANTYTGGTTVSAGTLTSNSQSLQGNILNNASVVFDQAGSGTYAGAMSGTGRMTLQGGGILTLTGNSTYSGPTIVNGGVLVLANNGLSSTVTVNSIGTLRGSGSVGGLANGGIVAPGTSAGIGTLNVAGNFTQIASGTYQVEINPNGQSSKIVVAGAAALGGLLQVVPVGSGFGLGDYTILTAAGGVSGTFSSVTSSSGLLKFTVSYLDPNSVSVTLQQAKISSGAQTPNQWAVGNALDGAAPNASGDFMAVLDALSVLSTTAGPAALDAISGQNYAAFSNSMVQGAQLFMNNYALQLGNGSRSGSRIALAEACTIACETTTPGLWGAWGGALGGVGTIGAGANNNGTTTYNVGGFAAGLDRQLAPNFLAGVTVGYTTGMQWVSGFNGQSASNTFQVGLYGSFNEGPVYLDGMASYAYTANQMWRSIAIPGLQSRTAQGWTGANQFFGQVEGGYRVELGGTAAAYVTPFARLQAYTGTQNAFSETGAQSLNLSVATQTTNSLRSVIGAQLGGSMDLGWRDRLYAQLRLGWSHEFADVSRPVTAALAGGPGFLFTTYGAAPQRDGAVVGVSMTTAIAQASSLYLRYEGNISGQDSAHALTAGARMMW